MKKLLVLISLVAVMAIPAAQAADFLGALTSPNVMVQLARMEQPVLGDLINWKVGDGATYQVSLASLPIHGTMTKTVTRDDGDGTLWFNQTLDLIIQKQSIDIQMSREDGKILKYMVNGQEQPVPNEDITVLSQDYGSVTVPAGTFKAIHIKAKTTENGQDVLLEEWANPKDTCMDGSIKTIMTMSGQDITMEMTKFTKN